MRLKGGEGTSSKRILLCNPAFPRKVKGMPLSLLTLAGSLRHPSVKFRGRVCLLDLDVSANPEKELENTLKDFEPTHFGITRFTPTAIETMDILRRVKEHDGRIITITGGPHEVFYHDRTREEAGGTVDHVVSDVDGIAAFHRILGMESELSSLDVLPAYDLILQNMDRYQFEDLFDRPMAQAVTSRGCDGWCSFCCVGPYAAARLDSVRMILENLSSHGFGAVYFDDANFATYRKRTIKLASEVIADLNLEWGCQTRADSFDEGLIKVLKNSGCSYVCTALESADTRVLESISKGLEPSEVIEAVALLRKFEIRVGLYVIFGHPIEVESPEIASATLDMVERLKPDFLSISMYANYYGKNCLGELSREKEWLYFDEGWGAYHDAPLSHAIKVKEEIEARKNKNPEIWDAISIF